MINPAQRLGDWALTLGTQQGGAGRAASTTSSLTVVLWAGLLIVVAVAGGLAIMLLRGRLLGARGAPADAGSALEEMRRMRDSGQMSREEFDAARAAIIGRVSGRAPATGSMKVQSGGAGVRVARPGFDLTGRPLPGSKGNDPRAGPPG